jgi:hypothetical protein
MITMTNGTSLDPVDELDRIRHKLAVLADARRHWSLTPRDERAWDELTGREYALLRATDAR